MIPGCKKKAIFYITNIGLDFFFLKVLEYNTKSLLKFLAILCEGV